MRMMWWMTPKIPRKSRMEKNNFQHRIKACLLQWTGFFILSGFLTGIVSCDSLSNQGGAAGKIIFPFDNFVGHSKKIAELALKDAEVNIAKDKFGFAQNDVNLTGGLEPEPRGWCRGEDAPPPLSRGQQAPWSCTDGTPGTAPWTVAEPRSPEACLLSLRCTAGDIVVSACIRPGIGIP